MNTGCLSNGRKPAAYSLPMEVLATIPFGQPVPLRTLSRDFRVTYTEMLGVLRGIERDFGIGTIRQSSGGAISAKVEPKDRARVNVLAGGYMDAVYAD